MTTTTKSRSIHLSISICPLYVLLQVSDNSCVVGERVTTYNIITRGGWGWIDDDMMIVCGGGVIRG